MAAGPLSTALCLSLQEIERRRGMMRQRAQERKTEEMEVMELEDEGRSGEESESESEYEEYTDSEDEMEPRLKPVFIRKWVLQPCGSPWERSREPGPWRPHFCGLLFLPRGA